ncbi:MAG: tetratricopeptide repeat protein [Candidatus Methanomethylophilus sp.]|nr:tetratricopeptide repeat protein [Methanomethylophilus sp.]MDD3233071.1 tetratricopeptide repeat protein [Methanomethylophilus sp.]MDD4222274.1 tetratricopeptide repeat protein [Methanomethylophilus sp.]MDD4668441.1 tetratricopeptide repeat protein [Methanomethylophilus sp.]
MSEKENPPVAAREVPPPKYPGDLYVLGRMYYQGMSVPVDKAKAAALFGLAADQGNPEAQLHLGLMFMLGDGVPEDPEKAATLFGDSFQQGNSDAAYFLALLYAGGRGLPANDAEAVRLCTLAANAGCRGAQVELAKWYRAGQHLLPQNMNQALIWLKKAAAAGYADALYELGCMLFFGEGMLRDQKNGRMFLEAAAAHGDTDASHTLNAIGHGAKARPEA